MEVVFFIVYYRYIGSLVGLLGIWVIGYYRKDVYGRINIVRIV